MDELERADVEVVRKAVDAAARLSPIEPCRDAVLLGRSPPPPTEQRNEIDEVRAELSRARTLSRAGKYTEGLESARES